MMQPNPKGYGDDFIAKCGHCNGIHEVNGIHVQWISAKMIALTMTYCRKCICLYSKTIPSNPHPSVRTENASGLLTAQQVSKSAGLFAGTVICSSSGFQLGSSIKTRSNEVHIMDLLSRALSLLVFLGFTFQLATLSFYMNWSEEFVFLNCSSDSSNCKEKLGIPGSILEKKWQKMTWACFIPALYTVT